MTDVDGRLKEGRGRRKLRYFLLAGAVALGGLGCLLFLRAPTDAVPGGDHPFGQSAAQIQTRREGW